MLVAGANGQVGQHIVRFLAERGYEVQAMIRDEGQAQRLLELGGEPVVADLEGEVFHTVEGCDAVIFSAGGGPGSGPEKKETIDYGGASKLIRAATEHGANRFLVVSSVGAQAPESANEKMQPYLRAKARADEELKHSGLDYTIVRPGPLTDERGTSRIEASTALGRREEIPREDVAHTMVAALEKRNTFGKTFEIFAGDTPIEEALASL